MKKVNLKFLLTLLAISTIVWGCGLKKMIKKYPEVKYEVQPQVLESHGGKINVTVTGTIPAKYFHKKAIVDFTPVLKYNGGEYALKSLTLQGEKAKGTGTVISKKTGGSFTYTDVITYKPEMNKSELIVNCKVNAGKKELFLGDRKLADGVIYTSERVVSDENIVLSVKENTPDMPYFEKEVLTTKKANIYFAYQLYAINMNLPNNKKEENVKALTELKDFVLNNWVKRNFDLTAWASPEGEERYNQGLSDNRAKAAEKYFRAELAAQYKKMMKAKYNDTLKINSAAKGEDWEGFVKSVQGSTLADKSVILNVVNSQPDVQKREQEIKNMTIVYKEIENDILPSLRRAEITVVGLKPARTDAEIAKLSASNPDSLSLVELLYAAELTEDNNARVNIYKSVVEKFPKDWRAYNNLGYCYLKLNNIEEAQKVLEQGNSIVANKGMILNNLGVAASWKKDFEAAKSYFESAQANGQDASYNLALISIRKGDYAGAIGLLGELKCNYNKGLAQLLSKDNAGAQESLDCAKKTAEVYYLTAVLGARTNNVGMIAENLRNAIAADAKYREQAKDDREFLKFFNNSQFTDAIK
ncbi:MAG: tetratricopeptide repeat protein [Bacteroidota bacterium]